MKGLLFSAAALCFVASTALGAPIIVESFSHTPATSLLGKSPDGGTHTWTDAAPGGGDDLVINAGSMSPTAPYSLPAGYPAPSGGSVTYGGQGRTYVLPIGSQTTGTVYYSMLVRVSDLGALTGTTPGIMGGFSSVSTGGGTNPSIISALFGRPGSVAGTYQLGVSRNSNPVNAAFSGDITLGDTVFVVASYEFVASTANDIAKLWINPAGADFGAAEASVPAPTVTGLNTGNDSTIASFILYQRGTSSAQFGATGESADELRIGTSWADVTPVPEPATLGILAIGATMLASRKRTK